MTFGVTLAYDVTGSNYARVPAGQRCGYDTGSQGIPWTAAMWAASPGAVHIDQAPVNTAANELSDVLDVERGAATFADVAPWAKAAAGNFARNARPGQRRPAVYFSASAITSVVNALTAGGVTGGVGLWVANWNLSQASAAAAVAAASGPFPVIGVQFTDTGGGGAYDLDIFSLTWLTTQSGAAGDTVAEGSSGPAVAALQRRLAAWGHPDGADGLFGPGTLAALRAFQAARNLVTDGVAGPATWTELDASPVPVPVPSPPQVPAPAALHAAVTSTGAHATLSWGAVAGVTSYTYQLEYYKPGFGWVLAATKTVSTNHDIQLVAPATRFRFRASSGTWSAWAEFTTP